MLVSVQIPAVQQEISSFVENQASQLFHTQVKVGNVSLGFLNRIVIDNVEVKDQRNQSAVNIRRLTARLRVWALFKGKVDINSAQLFGAKFNIYQEQPNTPLNIQFIMDALSSADTTKKSNTDVRINTLIIRNAQLHFNQLWKTPTPGKFNPSHIGITKLGAYIKLRKLTNDSINLEIKNLEVKEASGLSLKRATMAVEGNPQHLLLKNVCMEMPASIIRLSNTEVKMMGCDTLPLIQRLSFPSTTLEVPKITLSDFGCLVPELKTFNHPLQLNITAAKEKGNITLNQLCLKDDDNNILVAADGQILSHNLDKESMYFSGRITQCAITNQGIKTVASHLPIAQKALTELDERAGFINLTAHVVGSGQGIQATTNINSQAGPLMTSATYQKNHQFTIRLQGGKMDAARLLKNEQLTTIQSPLVQAKGYYRSKNDCHVEVNAKVDEMVMKGHAYQQLKAKANYHNGLAKAQFNVDDNFLTLNAAVETSLTDKNPRYKADIALNQFNPHALQLTHAYPNCHFSAHIKADIQQTEDKDFLGQAQVNDIIMAMPDSTIHIKNLEVSSTRNNGNHQLNLHSDLLHVEATGHFTPTSVVSQMKRNLAHYMPVLFPNNSNTEPLEQFRLEARILPNDMLQRLASVPLVINEPLTLSMTVNSANKSNMNLVMDAPSIIYNKDTITQVSLKANGSNIQLNTETSLVKSFKDEPVMLNLQTSCHNNFADLQFRWKNLVNARHEGEVLTANSFYRDRNGDLAFQTSMLHSNILVDSIPWTVFPSAIVMENKMLKINQFLIQHNQQHLAINGIMCKDINDSIMVDLNQVGLSYVFNLLNFHSVDFTGIASGTIKAKGVMDTPQLSADLSVNNFCFNKGLMGHLKVKGHWDNEEKGIILSGHITDKEADALTVVDGKIVPGSHAGSGLDLQIKAQRTNLYFLNEYADEIFHNIQGRATGNVHLYGPFNKLDFGGHVTADAEATLICTNTRYTIKDADVELSSGLFNVPSATIYDRDNHPANVKGYLAHEHLRNMSYQFNLKSDNILGYDIKGDYNDLFYGTVYCGGDVNIKGRPGNILIDMNVAPRKGTEFVYNATRPEDLGDNKYIRFHSRNESGHSNADSVNHNHDDKDNSFANIASDLHINFNVNMNPSATVKVLMDRRSGDYITLNGTGNINASFYNKGAFTMHGPFNVTGGVYKLTIQDLIYKEFHFQNGGIISFNGNPYKSAINLRALYTIPSASLNDLNAGVTFSQSSVRVNCIMDLGGTVEVPVVHFDFELPNVNNDEEQMVRSLIATEEDRNMQVIYLLGVGRFYTYNNGTAQDKQSAIAMNSILSNTLSGQINNALTNAFGTSNWQIGTNLSTGNNGWNDMDIEGMISGSLFNNKLLINGTFGYRENQATTNQSGLIGDFDLQWKPFNNDKISFKGYSETNDRYFTKSAITTQGIGIIFKHDFQRWQDLFRWNKKKRLMNNSSATVPVDTLTHASDTLK